MMRESLNLLRLNNCISRGVLLLTLIPFKMAITNHLVSQSFDRETKTLKSIWRFIGYDVNTTERSESGEIFISENPRIKWRIGVQMPAINFVRMVEGSDLGFKYNLNFRRIYDNGIIYNEHKSAHYEGALVEEKSRFASNVSVVNLELTVIYPEEALIPSQTKPLFSVFKTEIRNMFCDVKFKVDDETVEAHRCVLANKSPVFMKELASDTKDGKQNAVIEIKDEGITHVGFARYLDLIYGLDVPLDDPMICLEIIQLAEKYDTQDIKEYVEYEMMNSISRENVIRVMIAADMNGASNLKKAAMQFLVKNPVHEMPDFEELAKKTDLLKETFALFYQKK